MIFDYNSKLKLKIDSMSLLLVIKNMFFMYAHYEKSNNLLFANRIRDTHYCKNIF